MPTGFPHQDSTQRFSQLKSVQTPQHGRKADDEAAKVKEKRSFEPRPGH